MEMATSSCEGVGAIPDDDIDNLQLQLEVLSVTIPAILRPNCFASVVVEFRKGFGVYKFEMATAWRSSAVLVLCVCAV